MLSVMPHGQQWVVQQILSKGTLMGLKMQVPCQAGTMVSIAEATEAIRASAGMMVAAVATTAVAGMMVAESMAATAVAKRAAGAVAAMAVAKGAAGAVAATAVAKGAAGAVAAGAGVALCLRTKGRGRRLC